MDPEPYVLIAQLSDPHIVERDAMLHGVLDTEPYLVAAVELLRHLDPQPGLVLISGDLVNEGRPEQYENLRRLLEPLQVPVRLMCGNHDDPVGLRQVFRDHTYLGSSGQVSSHSPAAEQLVFLAKQMVAADQVGREWTSEDPELADRYSSLVVDEHLAERIAGDAAALREVLGL